jgi:hypothetical protein
VQHRGEQDSRGCLLEAEGRDRGASSQHSRKSQHRYGGGFGRRWFRVFTGMGVAANLLRLAVRVRWAGQGRHVHLREPATPSAPFRVRKADWASSPDVRVPASNPCDARVTPELEACSALSPVA